MSTIKIRVGNVTLPVYGATSGGKTRYELRWHGEIKVAVDTTVHREKFSSKTKALARGREVATAIANGEIARLEVTGEDALRLRRIDKILQPTGKDPEQLCLEYVAKWEKEQKLTGPGGMTIEEIAERFIAAKTSEGCSDYYLRDFKLRLGRLSAEFKKLPLAHLTTEDTQAFLDSLKVGPRTWNNHLASIRSLAGYAKEIKLIPADWDILDALKLRKLAWKRPETFTPEEMRLLLDTAQQPLRRCLALSAFAGMRTEEVHRIKWDDFKWELGYIHVSEDVAKTRQHAPPILDALKVWIGTIETTGQFCPYKTAKSLSGMRVNLCKRLALKGRRNPLRKSWISYRLAVLQNEAQVADEAGTSVHDIHRHYLNRPSAQEAYKWFGIRPNFVPQNIVQLALPAV
jgi:integrase